MGEVADVGDDFVVLGGCFLDDGGAESFPELDGLGEGARVGLLRRGDEAGSVFEERAYGVVHTCLFGASHGVGADEMSFSGEGGFAALDDVRFHAADVCDDGVSFDGGGEFFGEGDDAVDWRAEHNHVGVAAGFGEVAAGSRAPGL